MSLLFDTFKTRAEAVSAEVHRFATKAETRDFILAFLRQEHVADVHRSRAVWANGSPRNFAAAPTIHARGSDSCARFRFMRAVPIHARDSDQSRDGHGAVASKYETVFAKQRT